MRPWWCKQSPLVSPFTPHREELALPLVRQWMELQFEHPLRFRVRISYWVILTLVVALLLEAAWNFLKKEGLLLPLITQWTAPQLCPPCPGAADIKEHSTLSGGLGLLLWLLR